MKIVCISDTHCQHTALNMPEGDVLVHAGDWTHRGSESDTINFLKWFEGQQQYKHRVFIAGNHDFYPEREPTEFKKLCNLYAPSCTYLQDSEATIEGYKFYGSPVSPFFCNWAFNKHRGPEIQQYWDLIPDDVEVLVTHGPVLGFGDKLSEHGSEPGKHVGCANLLSTVDSRLKDLKLVVTAHIHEGSGIYFHGDIVIVNAAVLDERYRLRNSPRVIDLPHKLK